MAMRSKIWPISLVLTLLLFAGAGTALATPVSVDQMTLVIEIDAGKPQSEGGAGYVSLPWFTVQADFQGTLDVDWTTGVVNTIDLTETASTRVIVGDHSEPLRLGGDLITVGNGISQSTVSTASLTSGGYEASFDLRLQIDMLIEGMTPTIWPLVNKDSILLKAEYDGPAPSDGFHFLSASVGPVALYHKAYIDYSTVRPFGKVTAETGSEPVPEPGTLLLLGAGFLGVLGCCRNVRKKA